MPQHDTIEAGMQEVVERGGLSRALARADRPGGPTIRAATPQDYAPTRHRQLQPRPVAVVRDPPAAEAHLCPEHVTDPAAKAIFDQHEALAAMHDAAIVRAEEEFKHELDMHRRLASVHRANAERLALAQQRRTNKLAASTTAMAEMLVQYDAPDQEADGGEAPNNAETR